MKTSFKKGFTLIELLVVIAIIGILSSVVLASLNSAKVKEASSPLGMLESGEIPAPTDYAVDATGILTAEQLAALNERLKALDTDKHQFGILVVDSTAPYEIEEYGIKVAEAWKVGHEKLDNGAIIILATGDRNVRIEVGYGLEGDITDAKAGRIIDEYMIPSLKNSDWYGALMGGIAGLEANVK